MGKIEKKRWYGLYDCNENLISVSSGQFFIDKRDTDTIEEVEIIPVTPIKGDR